MEKKEKQKTKWISNGFLLKRENRLLFHLTRGKENQAARRVKSGRSIKRHFD